MEKFEVVRHILRSISHGTFINSAGGTAWAPSNVALCKYWGKRDATLNLPVTSSLSLALGNKGAFTQIKQEGRSDNYVVNGKLIGLTSVFAQRLQNFLNLFRPPGAHYFVNIDTNVPVAAGLASSACGFASLVQALNQLYDWRLSKRDLSILARLGSGSASRSLFSGFVEWQRGENYDGMDSYSVQLKDIWPELRVGTLVLTTQEKAITSTAAMQHTMDTSPLYSSWPRRVNEDLAEIKLALARKDFVKLGQVAEANALAMHELMLMAQPPIVYSLPETFAAMEKVRELRLANVPVFFTQDAGSNLQLLFLVEHEPVVLQVFPELDVILPFVDSKVQQVVLVNENDVEVGTSEKLAAHIQGKLHRAFSVFVLRKRPEGVEILLQQRSSIKYHSANLWSNTCCGHPRLGEDIKKAAERRLYEEMGIRVALTELGKFHYTASFSDLFENELDHVFFGYSELDDFPINEAEVQAYRWTNVLTLQQDLQLNPRKYTVWLPQALKLLLQFTQR